MTLAVFIPRYEPRGWILLALMLPGLLVLIAIVLRFLLAKPSTPASTQSYFIVTGLDAQTGQAREATFPATNPESAAGQAHLAGIVVTEIRPLQDPTEVRTESDRMGDR